MKKNTTDPKTTTLLKTLKSQCSRLVEKGTKAARAAYLIRLNKEIAAADKQATPTEKSEKNKLLLLQAAGVIHLRNQDYKAAEKNFARIIAHPQTQAATPDEQVPAYLSLSIAYLGQEEFLAALKNLSAIRKLAPQNYRIPLITSFVYRGMDNYPAMLANCTAAQRIIAAQKIKLPDLDKELLHEDLAIAHSALNNEALARKSLKIVFKLNPNNDEYRRVMKDLTTRLQQRQNFIKPAMKDPELVDYKSLIDAKGVMDGIEKAQIAKMKNKIRDSLSAELLAQDCYVAEIKIPKNINLGR